MKKIRTHIILLVITFLVFFVGPVRADDICSPGYCGPDPNQPRVNIDIFNCTIDIDGNCQESSPIQLSWICDNISSCSGNATTSPKARCKNNKCNYNLNYNCCVLSGSCSSDSPGSVCDGSNFGASCNSSGGVCQAEQNQGGDGGQICTCEGGGGDGDPPPTPPPGDNNPVGYLDSFVCGYNASTDAWTFEGPGWAGDPDNASLPTRIEYYVDDATTTDSSKLLGYVDPADTFDGSTAICSILLGPSCSSCVSGGGESLPQCRHRSNSKTITVTNAAAQTLLTDGNSHTIYARAANLSGGTYPISGNPSVTCDSTPPPTETGCTLNIIPETPTTYVGGTFTFNAVVTPGDATAVTNVTFALIPGSSGVGSLATSTDSSSPYQSLFTGLAAGTVQVRARALLDNYNTCEKYADVTVAPSAPPDVPQCYNFSGNFTLGQNETAPLSCTAYGASQLSDVRLYYSLVEDGKNYCDPGTWTEISPVNINNPFLPYTTGDVTALADSTGLADGDYVIVGNVYGTNGQACTGNPSGDCNLLNWSSCAACSTVMTVASCSDPCPATQCGGSNACGQSCSNSDGEDPAEPIITSPGATLNLTSGAQQVPITWTEYSPDLTDSYLIKVYDRDLGTANIDAIPCIMGTPDATEASCYTPNLGTTSQIHVPLQVQGNQLTIAIKAINTTCAVQAYSTWDTQNVDLVADISGAVYIDASPSGSGLSCTGAAVPAPLEVGSSVTVTDSNGGNHTAQLTPAVNTFTLTNVPYYPSTWSNPNLSALLSINNSNAANSYACTCPGSCQVGDVASPNTTVDFFVNLFDLSQVAWWQARAGLVYGEDGFTSVLPPDTTCTEPDCIPYLITKDSDDTNYSASFPVTADNHTLNAGNQAFTDQRPGADEPRIYNSDFTAVPRQDYQYFAQNFALTDATTVNQITDAELVQEPTGSIAQPDGSLIYYRNGDLTVNPGSALDWAIINGEKKIIFVNGDLTITNSNPAMSMTINVLPEGFLAFIVSGDIIISPEVGDVDPASTTNTISGLYVADGKIIIEGNSDPAIADRKFNGYGTFVGWDGVELNRDYADGSTGALDNGVYPTEVFRFRESLVRAFPSSLAKPTLSWQEVN